MIKKSRKKSKFYSLNIIIKSKFVTHLLNLPLLNLNTASPFVHFNSTSIVLHTLTQILFDILKSVKRTQRIQTRSKRVENEEDEYFHIFKDGAFANDKEAAFIGLKVIVRTFILKSEACDYATDTFSLLIGNWWLFCVRIILFDSKIMTWTIAYKNDGSTLSYRLF